MYLASTSAGSRYWYVNPHTTLGKYRGGSRGVDSDGILRIATNLLDVPADVISLIFANRGAIEIFFRYFKHMLGCRHLLSRDQNGIEIQTYCAIIACMLIALWTDKKPTLRTYEMICFYFIGLADVDELMRPQAMESGNGRPILLSHRRGS